MKPIILLFASLCLTMTLRAQLPYPGSNDIWPYQLKLVNQHGFLFVASNLSWTASSDQEWLTVSPGSGTGPWSLDLNGNENPTQTMRTATINITIIGVGTLTANVIDGVYQTVNVTAGGLAAELFSTQFGVEDLTITGTIDARDFQTIRDNTPSLRNLDLSGAEVVAYNDNPANTIPKEAFFHPIGVKDIGKTMLRSVQLPQTITTIGNGAFSECTGLISVNIPSSVTTLGSGAFFDCSSMNSIIIPASVTSIGVLTFNACSGLTSITIPSSVNFIGFNAFANCTGLSSIYVHKSSPIDLSDGESPDVFLGVNKTTCTLYVPNGSTALYAAAEQWKDFTNIVEMPGFKISATTINIAVSEGSTSKVELTANVDWTASSDQTWLTVSPTSGNGDHTLTFTAAENPLSSNRTAIVTVSAEGVESQTITVTQVGSSPPINVTAGGLKALFTAEELASITKLKLTGTIDARDFKTMRDDMPLLAELDLSGVMIVAYSGNEGPAGNMDYPANAVPESAFQINGHTNTILTIVLLPESVNDIGKSAFFQCSSLKTISIPPNLTAIKDHTFFLCSSLTNITIPLSVVYIGYETFDGCTSLTSITIPPSVETLGTAAFDGCNFSSIIIPASVKSIGNGAFEFCRKLTSITVEWSIPLNLDPSLGVFYQVDKTNCILYVPYGSSALYAVANQWKDFTNIVEMPGFQLSETTVNIALEEGSTASVNITSNTAWTASSDQTWLTVSPTSGTGDHTLTFIAGENPLSSTRSAIVTVSAEGVESRIITVTQDEGPLTTQLRYRFANPRVINGTVSDSFEFDVQVKASEAGTFLWSGLISLSFDNTTLSTDVSEWVVTKVGAFSANNSHGNAKYGINLFTTGTAPGMVMNIGFSGGANALNDPATSADFTEVTTTYQTIFSLRGKITSNTGTAGIDFNEANMNGQQSHKLSASPYFEAYNNPNRYGSADFTDSWVGRVFCAAHLWTQVGGLNWANAVNTSVWDGDAAIPGGSLTNASNLRIHSPATLTIPVNGMMTITGDSEIKTMGGLTMVSDRIGTGSLITATASGAGSASVQRYMTTDAWHIVSSPLSGQSISSFLTSNANVATSEDDAVRGMMDYNPALNEWNDYFSNTTKGNLRTGQGFCMRTNANSSVTFSGSLQAGSIPANGLTPGKWNCTGNPFTSSIGINTASNSMAKFLVENAGNLDPLFGAIYIWDQSDAGNGLWGKYTVISNASPTFDVQQGQAFMLKMNNAKTSVSFNSGMQLHNPALALKSTKTVWPTIKLIASVNSTESSTIIAFNNGMTKGLDRTYDAGLLKGGSDLVVYSWLVEDNGVPFAIQALPENEYNSMIIPIGLDFNTGGEVTFSSELINLSSDCQVILEDRLNSTFTDLSKKVYTTSVGANSSISDRLRLHTSYLTTGLEAETQAEKLCAYAIRNVEMIVQGDVSNQAVATVYDVMGRLVLTEKLDAGNRNTIRLPMIKSGIYMLRVKDKGIIQAFKIPVRE